MGKISGHRRIGSLRIRLQKRWYSSVLLRRDVQEQHLRSQRNYEDAKEGHGCRVQSGTLSAPHTDENTIDTARIQSRWPCRIWFAANAGVLQRLSASDSPFWRAKKPFKRQ